MNKLLLKEKKITADHVLYGIISAVAFAAMMNCAGKQSLWFDDIVQITISKGLTLGKIFKNLVNMDTNPPLFGLFAAVWLRIVPYGTIWLRLPSAIAVAVGIFIYGLAGRKIRNARTGIICAILAATSTAVLYEAGLTFRPYGFFFMFSSLVVFLYVDRFKFTGKERKGTLWRLSLAFCLLAYTHYFGILMLMSFFLADIVLFIKKKISWICFLPYFIALFLFLPWLFYGLLPVYIKRNTFWPQTPNWITLLDTIKHFASNNSTIFAFCLSGIFIVATAGIILLIKRRYSFEKYFLYAALIFAIAFVILISYVYSVYINPATSIYVNRYFIGIIGIYYLIVACGFDMVCNIVLKNRPRLIRNAANVIMVGIITVCISPTTYDILYGTIYVINEPWEQTADWLMAQDDLYDEKVLVAISTFRSAIDGFKYYLTKNGKRKGIDVVSSLDAKTLDGINKIYYCQLHSDRVSKTYMKTKFNLETNVKEVPITIYRRIIN